MNPKEPRRIWLITKDGIPKHCAWAMVKTLAETSQGTYGAALSADQDTTDGWDATPTQWRSVPEALRPGAIEHGSPAVVGRDVTACGLKYNLDTGGRVHPTQTEPYEPDAIVEDEDALLTAIEAAGKSIKFVESGTLKQFLVNPDTEATIGGYDVLINRQGGVKTRTDT